MKRLLSRKCVILLAIPSLIFLQSKCSPRNQFDFTTDYFKIRIDEKGYINSMQNTTVTPHREFSPTEKPSPLA